MNRDEQQEAAAKAIEEALSDPTYPVPEPRKLSRRQKGWIGAVVLLVVGLFVFPWPQTHAYLDQQAAEREAKIMADIKAEDAARDAAQARKDAAADAVLWAASVEQVTALVDQCADKIRGTPGSHHFDTYFVHYDAEKLRSFGGMLKGRPSVVLDDYGFDQANQNVADIMRKDYPSREVEFVVESAVDSFGGPKSYAAVYDCDLHGLSVDDPRQVDTEYFDP